MTFFDPFQILNVSRSAGIEEITQARRRLARIYHPDVSESGVESVEIMQKINRAFEILSDPDRRREFFDSNSNDQVFQHSHPTWREALKGSEFRSREFLAQFRIWQNEPIPSINVVSNSGIYTRLFEAEIDAGYSDYVNKIENRKRYDQFDLDDIYKSVEHYFYFKDDLDDILGGSNLNDKAVTEILFSNRNCFTRISGRTNAAEQVVIVHLRSFNFRKLKELLFAIDPKRAIQFKDKNIDAIVESLIPALPNIELENSRPSSKANNCFKCGAKKSYLSFYYNCISCAERFCEKCIIKKGNKLPRLGFISGQVCQTCFDENEKWEVECWLKTADGHLKSGYLNKALFCFNTGLKLDMTSARQNKVGTRWVDMIRNDYIRAIFLFDVISTNIQPESTKFYLSELAKSLQGMADTQSNDDDKYQLYLSSMKVHFLNGNAQVQSIISLKENMAALMKKFVELNANSNSSIVNQLVNLIQCTNLKEIVELLIKNKSSLKTKIAFKVYFEGTTLTSWPGERAESSFLFAKGVFQIFYGLNDKEIMDGFNDLEFAYWKSLNFPCDSTDLYVQVLMRALSSGIGFPFETLFRIAYPKNRQEYFFALLPERGNLRPSNHQLWSNITLQNKSLKPFKIYERAIYHNHEHKIMAWDRLKSVLAYIDLIDGCENIIEIIFCFVHAAAWSLDAMEDSQTDARDKYAFSRMLYRCVENASTLSHMYLDTVSKACVFHYLFGLAYYGNRFNIEKDANLVGKLFKFFLFGSSLMPIANLPLPLVCESIILTVNLREMSQCLVKSMLESCPTYHPMETFVYKYLQFERNQHSINSEEESDHVQIQLETMGCFLNQHKIEWANVIDFIDYPLVKRTKDGWLVPNKKLNLNRNHGNFSKFNGFTINKTTNELTLLLETATNPFLALFVEEEVAKFTWADIATIMCNLDEASMFYFSLDPIDEKLGLHPFQKFDYSPKYLKGSMILHTLFHSDYLLKQFSMGIEVNCLPPFNQRDMNIDTSTRNDSNGLYKLLPAHLKQALKSIDQRGHRQSKVSRLWIQAEKLEYQIVDTDNELQFLFGNLKMSIKTHPMFPNSEGVLVDTDVSAEQSSPEYEFARDFTKSYEEISKYFPEFARLKELCKLQYLGIFLKIYLDNFDENIRLNTEPDRLKRIYDDNLESCKTAIRKYLDDIVMKIRSDVPDRAYTRDFFESIARTIHSAIDCSEISRNFIQSWLEAELMNTYFGEAYQKKMNLIDSISKLKTRSIDNMRREIETTFREKKSAFERSIKNQVDLLAPIYAENRKEWPKDKTEWIPALFKHIKGERRFIYGGVVLCPELEAKGNLETNLGKTDRVQLNSEMTGKLVPHKPLSGNKFIYVPPKEPPPSPSILTPVSWCSPDQFSRQNLYNFIKYKNELERLFPDLERKERFKEQLRFMVKFINECKLASQSNAPFIFTPHDTYKAANSKYNRLRNDLKRAWSEKFGIPWPTEMRNDRLKDYELHHIIPLQYGGPNELWNIIPLKFADHRGAKTSLHSTTLIDMNNILNDLCTKIMPDYNPRRK